MSVEFLTLNEFKQDIIEGTRDYIQVYKSSNIDEITEYIYNLLNIIYDKHFHKYIYKEIIQQIICEYFPLVNNSKFLFKLTEESVEKCKNRVNELLSKPQPEQRSEEWYNKRFNSIGASELASIFNKSPFCTYAKYLEKKLKPPDNTPQPFNIYCHHGVKYEPIAQQLYCLENKKKIIEFGSINHETIEYISASPDGITKDGIMLEIKCPFKREITGIPPIYYWYQMQQQLEVCKLNRCDFLECKITEYQNWKEFERDTSCIKKSCIVEFSENNKLDYIYPKEFLQDKELIIDWLQKVKHTIAKDKNKEYIRIILWKLEYYSCIPIYRNKKWWKENVSKINEFWNTVLEKRKTYVATPEIKSLKKKGPIEYLFLDDP